MPKPKEHATETERVQVSEGLAYGVTALLAAVLAFLRAPLYARWFRPAVYGDFALISSGADLVSSVILAVFANVLYRHYDRERRAGRLDELLSTVAVGAAGSLALAGPTAWIVGRPAGLRGAETTALLILLTVLATFRGLVSQINRMDHQVAAFVVGRLFDPVWQLGGPVLLFSLGLGGFDTLVSTAVAAGAGSLLVGVVWARRVLRGINIKKTNRKALSAALGYGLPLIPLAMAGWVISSSNRYVIQHFWGSEATGIFSMGYNLASMPVALFSSVLVMTIGPVVWERLNSQGGAQALALVRRASTLFLAVAFPSAIGLGMLADRVVEILLSPAYTGAAAITFPVALGSVLSGLYSFLVKPWELHEATRSVPLYVGAGAAANVVVNLWQVPRLGIAGAAWASLVGYAVVGGLMIVEGHRLYGTWLVPGWRDALPIGGGCGVMVIVLMMLKPVLTWPGVWGLAVLVGMGAVTYAVVLMVLGWALRSELLTSLSGAVLRPLREALGQAVAGGVGRSG